MWVGRRARVSLLLLAGGLAAALAVSIGVGGANPPAVGATGPPITPRAQPVAARVSIAPSRLPDGSTRLLPGHLLVAYYGTAGTGALGVLGSDDIGAVTQRLRRAARAYAGNGRRIQVVYELIATVADAGPGPDHDFSHDISRSAVRRFVREAHRRHVLIVLDVQPGRSRFLPVVRRWAWALRDPWVGLALDPEWRMGRHQVPGRTIGHTTAREVNRVSAWLQRLTALNGLPQKLLMVHEFRSSMVADVGQIRRRPGLAMVQHVDGFGTQRQKLATFHAVARPDRFFLGFKLFYRQDVHLMSPRRVLGIVPRVRFVSYQ